MPAEQIRRFFMQGWTYSHGLATLVNIGYYPNISEQEIHELLVYTGRRYIEGSRIIDGIGVENGSPA